MLFSRKNLVLKFYRRLLRMMERIEGQNQDGTAETDEGQATNVNEKHREEHIIQLKGEKT